MDKSERSGMATHGMHNTTLSKPLVVHRVAWVWPVHHQEDGKGDVLDEGAESVEIEEEEQWFVSCKTRGVCMASFLTPRAVVGHSE